MALSDRVLTAALFAEKVVAAVAGLGAQDKYKSPGYDLSQALRVAQLSVSSAGHYGAVLAIPGTNDMLKVCACAEDGYPTFAQWAQRNPGPGIPDIFWSIRISDDLFLCAMPRYRELNGDDQDRVSAMRSQGEHHEEPASYLGKAVQRICRELGKMARKDMHTGNFMFCPERGEYIITDPFAELKVGQDEAEGYATGKPRAKQMREQVAIDFDAPAREQAASVYKNNRKMFGADAGVVLIDQAFMRPRFAAKGPQIQNLPKARPDLYQAAFPAPPIHSLMAHFNKEFLCDPFKSRNV